MYSQDGLGLGHYRRSRNIAQAILAREPDAQILIISDSPAPPFAPIPGVDFLKLPTIIKLDHGKWETVSRAIDIDDAVRLRGQLILDVYLHYRPHTMLVDHMPVGALGELRPTLNEIQRHRRRPDLFLGLRDVLDSAEAIRAAWDDCGAYEELHSYDAALIYGCQKIYDADAAYGLTPSIDTVAYCNYVGPPQSGVLSDADGVPRVPYIMMMGGGGHDAWPLAQAFLDAYKSNGLFGNTQAVVLTGPTMARAQQNALSDYEKLPGVIVESRVSDTTAWIQHASALVTMGGYNSLCEVLALRKKALVVPRHGPSSEQRIRSRLFADRGLVKFLDPACLTVGRLSQCLDELLATDGLPETGNVPPLDGAARAAGIMLDPLSISKSTQSTPQHLNGSSVQEKTAPHPDLAPAGLGGAPVTHTTGTRSGLHAKAMP